MNPTQFPLFTQFPLQFTLSSDLQSVEVQRVPEGIRASSQAFQSQLSINTWGGSLVSLPVLIRNNQGVIVDAKPLLDSGKKGV